MKELLQAAKAQLYEACGHLFHIGLIVMRGSDDETEAAADARTEQS